MGNALLDRIIDPLSNSLDEQVPLKCHQHCPLDAPLSGHPRSRFKSFGARLGASIKAKLRHGHLLREILKQNRLTPLSITFQLACLVAYNEGSLDAVSLEAVANLLERLVQQMAQSGLRLDDEHETDYRKVESAFRLKKFHFGTPYVAARHGGVEVE